MKQGINNEALEQLAPHRIEWIAMYFASSMPGSRAARLYRRNRVSAFVPLPYKLSIQFIICKRSTRRRYDRFLGRSDRLFQERAEDARMTIQSGCCRSTTDKAKAPFIKGLMHYIGLLWTIEWWSQRESNPCLRRERPAS